MACAILQAILDGPLIRRIRAFIDPRILFRRIILLFRQYLDDNKLFYTTVDDNIELFY